MLDPELQIGTGPYVYEKGEKEVFMRYVKNPMYHGPEPQLDAGRVHHLRQRRRLSGSHSNAARLM